MGYPSPGTHQLSLTLSKIRRWCVHSWSETINLNNFWQFWGTRLEALDKNATVVTAMEPFDSTLFSHKTPSAYPPDRSHVVFPSVISYLWTDASLDATMASALRKHTDQARAAVLADRQDISGAAVYVNYALFGTPLEDMYGANVPKLRKIRAEIDPEDVMGLAGGFKF